MTDPSFVKFGLCFGALAIACVLLYYRNFTEAGTPKPPEFLAFQRLFLTVYYCMFMADWMQGPYVYALYAHYGFGKGEIGQLFIMGFGSSLIFGTFVGGLADKYGRKANCLIFVVLYSIGCLTKHFNNYWILMLGRLVGGISTSILYSAFETWMIHEHKSFNFSEDNMKSTFSLMTFGSGLVAIIAGLVSTFLASNFGYVAPFDGSLLLLISGGVFVYLNWKENYGDSNALSSGFDNFSKSWRLLIASEKVLLLGVIQSCFESAMYIFVFMWTPALEQGGNVIPHGLVFACFMVCLMIGSKLYEIITQVRSEEQIMRWIFVISSMALAMPILTSDHTMIFCGFIVFEICCGIYFPSVGTMRSRYIPEEVRSTVMNVFRMGLNIIVVVVLININTLATDTVFLLCTFLLTAAVVCQHRLFVLVEQNSSVENRAKAGLEVGEEMDDILSSKSNLTE
jgi:MFS transporter, MFS domain-containing protein family, molybdate-anion transporter